MTCISMLGQDTDASQTPDRSFLELIEVKKVNDFTDAYYYRMPGDYTLIEHIHTPSYPDHPKHSEWLKQPPAYRMELRERRVLDPSGNQVSRYIPPPPGQGMPSQPTAEEVSLTVADVKPRYLDEFENYPFGKAVDRWIERAQSIVNGTNSYLTAGEKNFYRRKAVNLYVSTVELDAMKEAIQELFPEQYATMAKQLPDKTAKLNTLQTKINENIEKLNRWDPEVGEAKYELIRQQNIALETGDLDHPSIKPALKKTLVEAAYSGNEAMTAKIPHLSTLIRARYKRSGEVKEDAPAPLPSEQTETATRTVQRQPDQYYTYTTNIYRQTPGAAPQPPAPPSAPVKNNQLPLYLALAAGAGLLLATMG